MALRNLKKCLCVKDSSFTDKSLKISLCEDSQIFINGNLENCHISSCRNCTIFVASVEKITSIDKCEKCIVCIASGFIRVSNTIDTTLNIYLCKSPVLFGDNKGLILAPHNIGYSELIGFLKLSSIPINDAYKLNYLSPILMNSESIETSQIYTFIKESEFMRLSVPFDCQLEELFLTPKEFIEVILEREAIFVEIQKSIKEANFLPEQEKSLHYAIQGYFREWLTSSGTIKSISDVLKMTEFE